MRPLACECTCVFAGELLVHTVHVAYLAAAYAYIAGGNITVGTEIAPEFKDERLAETHDFGVALAAGAEVGTTLASTHRESGESVLESLLEAEEPRIERFTDAWKRIPPLVRADGVVELYAVADVVPELLPCRQPRSRGM